MLNIFEFIKAVSGTVFDMMNSAYNDKPLYIFREKHVSHHWAVNEADPCLLMWSIAYRIEGTWKEIALYWSFGDGGWAGRYRRTASIARW